ncbi:hypothetical protein ADUPG1_010733 [Aduncisulcus paluster]|uniref:GH18 domain-containing protein n=1 Tax=Aduncisulcus paluster TaxID=2918883 RepID=A0ABQ5JSL0_9EUKA|nr:hypothetical protein ADUPG1_010733 [Aduncisulcus paluster]
MTFFLSAFRFVSLFVALGIGFFGGQALFYHVNESQPSELIVLDSSEASYSFDPNPYIDLQKELLVWGACTTPGSFSPPCYEQIINNINNRADHLIYFSKLHGFDRVAIFGGSIEASWKNLQNMTLPSSDSLCSIVKNFNLEGITVDYLTYLNDDHDDYHELSRVKTLVSSVYSFNLNCEGQISSILFDQEPKYLNSFQSFASMLYIAKETSNTLSSQRDMTYITIGSFISPFWLDGTMTLVDSSVDIVPHLCASSDYCILMDYTSSENTFQEYGIKFSGLLSSEEDDASDVSPLSAKGSLAVEVGWIDAKDDESFGWILESDIEIWFQWLPKMIDDFLGELKHNDINGTIFIHDYAQYFKLLHGKEPDEFSYPPSGLFTKMDEN